MLRHVRKFAWLIVTSVVILSLAVGALLAHEGRPVGDYRFTVGWQEEPAYEGAQNAVSVRVNKIVESEAMEEVESAPDDHGTPGHHGEDPESTPETSAGSEEPGESEDHHSTGEQDGDKEEDPHSMGEQDGDEGEDQHSMGEQDGDEDEDQHSMGEQDGDEDEDTQDESSGHHGSTIEAASMLSVAVETSVDSVSGLNVQIITEGFTFAPENVNKAHVAGEGYAHIYADGEKISRVYTPWYYLGDIEPGEHEIRVMLNANSHEEYTYGGNKVEATTVVNVPEPQGHTHATETVEAESQMSVSVTLVADPLGGANTFVGSEGLVFTPQNSGDHHVFGEGHGHLYVNGVEIGRIYGAAMQLGNLVEGTNEVRVALKNNEHSAYTWNGQIVEATASIEIAEGMAGAGDRGSSHGGNESSEEHTSRLIVPQGASKPLASLEGQDEGVAVPVEGLEGSLQVEVTHAASGASRVLDLRAAWNDPGHYVAGLIPTASGVYEFRVFGTIEGTAVDETFVSTGAGGDFDDVQTSVEIQFPEQLPELREVVAAAQGARNMAQQAQDTAIAAQEGTTGARGGGNALAVVALIIGIVGAVLGAGGVFLALRARQPE